MDLFEYIHDLNAKGADISKHESEIWQRYGCTRSILVLDSTGFSRVAKSHGVVHFLSRLAKMRSQLQSIIMDYKPDGFTFEADNIFAYFLNIDDSLRAASDSHRAMAQNQIQLTEDEPFRVCIGIGYGQLLYGGSEEGYFGHEMNLASLLGEDTANSGETLITGSAFDSADPDLLEGFEARQLTLSGIEETCYLKAASGH